MDYVGEAICLSLDALIFGLCLKSYIHNKQSLKAVQNASELRLNQNLMETLESNGGELSYVAIRGNVRAIGVPIKSANQPLVSSVVQRLSIKEHVVSRSSSGFWTENQRTINEVYNSVPFTIVSKGGQFQIEVMDALSAEILDMEVISDKFDPSNLGFMDHVWSFFTGVRKRGLQTIEEVLREGSFITAVGEVKDEGGGIKIQAPSSGAPYFITTMPVHSLIRRLDEKVSYSGWFSLGFGVIGIVICGMIAGKCWKRHKEWLRKEADRKRLESTRKDRRKQVRDAEDLTPDKICVVCQENPKEVILLPCGHVCLCEDCSEQITGMCPVCKMTIEGRNPAYIA